MEYGLPINILELKEADDEWVVEGYASVFNNVDLGNDRVMPGAFKRTLKEGPKVRFLMSHDPALVLGVPKMLKEDKKGLFVRNKISKTSLGSDTRQLLLDGALDSFSIGYNALEWKIVDGDIRELYDIELWEESLVSLPMNREAGVTRVKYMTLADRAKHLHKQLSELIDELRGPASHADRPLSETKQNEIKELLELCSGFDAVRDELKSVLTPDLTGKTAWHGSPMTTYKLAKARQRLANILQE